MDQITPYSYRKRSTSSWQVFIKIIRLINAKDQETQEHGGKGGSVGVCGEDGGDEHGGGEVQTGYASCGRIGQLYSKILVQRQQLTLQLPEIRLKFYFLEEF